MLFSVHKTMEQVIDTLYNHGWPRGLGTYSKRLVPSGLALSALSGVEGSKARRF
jgi:hypothetical protein